MILQKEPKKPRKRYLVFKLYSLGESPDFMVLSDYLSKYMRDFLGLHGLIDSSIKLIRYEKTTRYGIIRIASRDVNKILLGIIRIRKINSETVSIIPLKLTGNLNRAIKYLRRIESRPKT